MQTKDLAADIVITGAGPAGLALSALLGLAGFQVILIDAEKPAPISDIPSGRTAALLNSSLNVLRATGVWDDLQDKSTPLKVMKIIDDSHGGKDMIPVEFKATDIGEPQFGFNIPNVFLKSALTEKIKAIKAIRHLTSCRLQTYQVTGGKILAETEDGLRIHAFLIIGTDGRNSIVRSIAGIEAKKHDYEQMAMTCLISHTKPHNFTSTEFHRSGGPFTLVPMPGNQSSVVWVEKTEDAKQYLAMKKQDFEHAIQDRSRGLIGTITLTSSPESWPLMLLSSTKLTGERSALAAEAAHVLSPIGAQGLNLSLRDVATLAETITDAARMGEDIGSPLVLDRYERRRRTDIKSRVIGIDGLNRAVATDGLFLNDLRRMGLKGFNKIPALKSLVMQQGLAPAMDEGRLLSGYSL